MNARTWGRLLGACLAAVADGAIPQSPGDHGIYEDMKLTCDEMRRHPALVFGRSHDLGSGYGSPLDIEYDCPESLAQLPFLRTLESLASEIRSERGPQHCTGSIIYLHGRIHAYSRLEMGMAPRMRIQSYRSRADGGDGREKESAEYFRRWSYQGLYEYRLYRQFMEEEAAVAPALVEHFMGRSGFSESDAAEASEVSLAIYRDYAAGSFPTSQEEFMAETRRIIALADRVIGPDPALDDLSGDDLKVALRIALLTGQSQKLIAKLADRVGDLNYGDEPPLFNATTNAAHLGMLLDRGAKVDYENGFGKTALFYAIQFNDRSAVKLLLRRGADVNHRYRSEWRKNEFDCKYDIEHTARTTLMHAAAHADVAMLKMLVASGASLDDVDGAGYNATDHAIAAGNSANADFLKSKGLPSLVAEKQKLYLACAGAAPVEGSAEHVKRCYREQYGGPDEPQPPRR